MLLIELDINEVSIDESLFPNQEKDNFIYNHFLHYCLKFYSYDRPQTVFARVYRESIVIVRNHIYLSIAKDLGSNRIRAIIDPKSSNSYVSRLLVCPSVTELDWEAVKRMKDGILALEL